MKALRNVLLVNGLTSAATGLLLIVFAPSVADLFAAGAPVIFFGTGIFLVLFAVLVSSQGLVASPSPRTVRLISALDISWVMASLVLWLCAQGYPLLAMC